MSVRLRDVADRAGVSFKTVSNVINDHPHVAEATRARVRAAIDELGYRPNLTARSLRNGRSGFLGLAIPELTSTYFATLASQVSLAAKHAGQSVIIEQTGGTRAGEVQTIDDLSSRLVDGVVFSPLDIPNAELADRLGHTPVVILGEHEPPGGHDHLVIDNIAATAEVTQHLLRAGRERIAVIGHQPEQGTGSQRWRGVVQAFRQAGREVAADLVVSVQRFTRESGARAIADLIDAGTPFDAALCFNDQLALGAMHELTGRGLAVPSDVAVTGFDDIEDGRYHNPTLTTIRPDVAYLAAEAVRLIERRLKDAGSPPEQVTVPHQLVVRASTTG